MQEHQIFDEAGEIDLSELDLNLPPAITPRSTKRERKFAHVAKMAGKRYDRQRDRRTQIRTRASARSVYAFNSISQVNRHTGQPHEHAREIMRRTMTPFQRRAFAAKVAAQLGINA